MNVYREILQPALVLCPPFYIFTFKGGRMVHNLGFFSFLVVMLLCSCEDPP